MRLVYNTDIAAAVYTCSVGEKKKMEKLEHILTEDGDKTTRFE